MRSFGGIGPGSDPVADPARVIEVKEWARDAFGLDPATTILVAELTCTEPGCPPVETVIAMLEATGRREHRLHLPLREVAPTHIWQLAAGDHGCCR